MMGTGKVCVNMPPTIQGVLQANSVDDSVTAPPQYLSLYRDFSLYDMDPQQEGFFFSETGSVCVTSLAVLAL